MHDVARDVATTSVFWDVLCRPTLGAGVRRVGEDLDGGLGRGPDV